MEFIAADREVRPLGYGFFQLAIRGSIFLNFGIVVNVFLILFF